MAFFDGRKMKGSVPCNEPCWGGGDHLVSGREEEENSTRALELFAKRSIKLN